MKHLCVGEECSEFPAGKPMSSAGQIEAAYVCIFLFTPQKGYRMAFGLLMVLLMCSS